MPQLIVRYSPDHITPKRLREIGLKILPLVAAATSTDSVTLTDKDIEWILMPNGSGSIAPPVSIELRTIGFPERKKKLDQEEVITLKYAMLDAGLRKFVRKGDPLIWVQFLDPDGVHV